MPEKRDSAGAISGVTMRRELNAPIAIVFKAWTDPKQVEQWWGPHHFTNRVRKWEARSGGAIDIDMIGPDGTAYPMKGTFTEVSEPTRLVFKSAVPGPDGKPMFEVLNVITLTESGSRTVLTMQATITSRTDAAAPFLKGMEEGWTQTLERLDALVTGVEGNAE